MPWKHVTHMEEISRFVLLAQTDRFTVTELCEPFGISRQTGYKHLERYAATGLKGLRTLNGVRALQVNFPGYVDADRGGTTPVERFGNPPVLGGGAQP